jgi:copper homeostasis protein
MPSALPHLLRLEVCVEDPAGAALAEAAGAAQIELAANLDAGGTTPGPGLLERTRARTRLELTALVRPRGGDFCYSEEERAVMRADLRAVRTAGFDGVALGCLTPAGEVDRPATEELVRLAHPLRVTFHRAFDFTRDPRAALELLIELGVERVLSSGQERSAFEGRARLRELVEQAAGRIRVVAAGGVRPEHVRALVTESGVRELHCAAASRIESEPGHRNPRPILASPERMPTPYAHWRTDAERVRALLRALA